MARGEKHDVITMVEYEQDGKKRTRWTRIGAAWEKEPGKWSLVLDASPINGKCMIVPPKEDKNGI